MENTPTFILVVAAQIEDGQGRLLLQQRPAGKRHGGMWEFPGGKVEALETTRFALCREVAEELGVELDPVGMTAAGFAEEGPSGGFPGIVLLLYKCLGWSGAPEGLEGQNWGWFTRSEAAALDLPLMDRTLLEGLRPTGRG